MRGQRAPSGPAVQSRRSKIRTPAPFVVDVHADFPRIPRFARVLRCIALPRELLPHNLSSHNLSPLQPARLETTHLETTHRETTHREPTHCKHRLYRIGKWREGREHAKRRLDGGAQ